MTINKERVRALVEELRTTEKKQGRGSLKKNDEYCRLGIAIEKAIEMGCVVEVFERNYGSNDGVLVTFDGVQDLLPSAVREFYGFHSVNPVICKDNGERCVLLTCQETHPLVTATVANDEMRWDFKKIGDAIEAMYLKEEDPVA